jgi:uncharacterized protein (TIGR02145 family)
MKTTGNIEAATGAWSSPNQSATNSSGFSGAPGGARDSYGNYVWIGAFGDWWSSSQYDTGMAWFRNLSYVNDSAGGYPDDKQHGFSVRCLKD